MSDLKQENCPFCGSDNISAGEVSTDYAGGHGAQCTQSRCDDCGALGPEADLADGEVDYGDVKAITAWNRRDKLHALLRDFQALAHDNEYSLGDRLQRISSRITAVLNGGALDEFTPHLPRIVEQSFDIEAARAAASGRNQPEATAPAQDLSAAILALRPEEVDLKYQARHYDARHAAAALASSANALSAGDRVDALQEIATKLRRAGADIPAPKHDDAIKGATINGLSIALLLVDEAILQSQKGDKCES